jgi:hypothetical protein
MTETEKALLIEVRDRLEPGSGFSSLNLKLMRAKIEYLLGEREDGYVEGVGAFLPDTVTPLNVLSYARATNQLPDDLRDRISELLPIEISPDKQRLLAPAPIREWVEQTELHNQKLGARAMAEYLMHVLVELGALQTVEQWNAVLQASADEAVAFEGPYYLKKDELGRFVSFDPWSGSDRVVEQLIDDDPSCFTCGKVVPKDKAHLHATRSQHGADHKGRAVLKYIRTFCDAACVAKAPAENLLNG